MDYLIEYQDLSYKAYQQIKAMILKGEMKPGEKIVQELIAKQLGISRMPLHKAFQRLENELLVESQPRKGIFVRDINLSEIADAFECREAIEGIAARRTAEKITAKELEMLEGLFEPFRTDPDKADLIKYQEADHLFHNTIIKISGNRLLSKMEMLANILTNTYLRLIRPPEETLPEHFAMIEAFRQRNGSLAENLLRQHFSSSRQVVLIQMAKINREKIKQLTL